MFVFVFGVTVFLIAPNLADLGMLQGCGAGVEEKAWALSARLEEESGDSVCSLALNRIVNPKIDCQFLEIHMSS
eukprot:582155-Amphidinium_carterae.1